MSKVSLFHFYISAVDFFKFDPPIQSLCQRTLWRSSSTVQLFLHWLFVSRSRGPFTFIQGWRKWSRKGGKRLFLKLCTCLTGFSKHFVPKIGLSVSKEVAVCNDIYERSFELTWFLLVFQCQKLFSSAMKANITLGLPSIFRASVSKSHSS